MDRALALTHLGLQAQDWGNRVDAETHAEFAAAWRGIVDCPSEAEIAAAATAAGTVLIIDGFKVKMQAVLDAAAQAEGFDNIFSAVTYADEPAVPAFQTLGQGFRAWRSQFWAAGESIMADVLAGNRGVPTWDELRAELQTAAPAPTFS